MCLGVPGRIVAIEGPLATVDFWGLRREVRLDVVDEPVAVGDYVLNHVGFAIRRIPPEEIEETLALYETLLEAPEWEDAMAADVRDEIAATGTGRDPGRDEAGGGVRTLHAADRCGEGPQKPEPLPGPLPGSSPRRLPGRGGRDGR